MSEVIKLQVTREVTEVVSELTEDELIDRVGQALHIAVCGKVELPDGNRFDLFSQHDPVAREIVKLVLKTS